MPPKFIGYPQAILYAEASTDSDKLNTLLWGDYALDLSDEESHADFIYVKCRGDKGWVKKSLIQDNRLLEINFIDVGQGDGVFIVTPEDHKILIDAGKEDNMFNYLSWRFNLRAPEHEDSVIDIDALIITHSDEDHYGGFQEIVENKHFNIKAIYHNGIIERKGPDLFGAVIIEGGKKYLSDIVENIDKLKNIYDDNEKRGGKKYPKLLYTAYHEKGIDKISMLKKGSKVEGFGAGDTINLKVLAPVTETINQKEFLRVLGSDGETKNGHSIVLRLEYGDVKILLSGDLNEKAHEFLTQHYSNGKFPKENMNESELKEMIEIGKAVFEVDVAKSCHHGSDHFMDEFFSFINPVATVISSGDNETHTHPRPETLGTIGKHSRGKRPLIFSTELARSTIESRIIKESEKRELDLLNKQLKAEENEQVKAEIQKKIDQFWASLERNVAVYGAIVLRTDGKKIIMAQKKEQKDAGYIYWKIEKDHNGIFSYKD